MKNSAQITFVILLLFSLLIVESCQKDSESPEGLLQQWQVVSMRRPNSAVQHYPVKAYTLWFKNKQSLSFKLDVNQCEGNYTVSQPGKIKITRLSYTEICCDSDLAQELASFLHHVNTYKVQDDTLTLSGIGEIKLKKIN